MRNYLTYGSFDSRDFGVYISGEGVFNAPSRNVNFIAVPGRDGDIIGPATRLQNIRVKYPAFIYTNFKANLRDFRSALLSLTGYHRLSDSYHPDEYRLATFTGPLDINVESRNDAGRFDIEFACKPQRFLTSGDAVVTLAASGSITNPTRFDAQPVLTVYGAGVLGIGSQSVTIASGTAQIILDCEMQDAYFDSQSLNSAVTLSGYKFPVLAPGVNNISLGSGITKVEIQPRWWTV